MKMSLRRLNRRDGQLLLVSFLILFLEMSLLRWISTEVRIFAYVNNLVLLACFLGMGLGCQYAKRDPKPIVTLLSLLALILLVTNRFFGEAPILLSIFSDSHVWFAAQRQAVILQLAVGLVSTLTMFALILTVFFPLGQILGRLFNERRDIVAAYSLNIAASLVGIWVFNELSFAYTPPWFWFATAVGCLSAFIVWTTGSLGVLCGGVAVLLVMAGQPMATGQTVLWSPYQKLQVSPLQRQPFSKEYHVSVNNVNYMLLLDLSDRALQHFSGIVDLSKKKFSHYDIPYLFKRGAQDVLIVGAGGGNDAAGALRNGATRITAVEIDPGIYRIGRTLHPESPYSNPHVQMVIDDARSFFKRCNQRFDLMTFGLLDSHTLGSTLTNTRIDHYVYTEESFREAKALLKGDGVLTVTFEVPRVWVRERIRGLLRQAFGVEPLVFNNRPDRGVFGWGGEMFVVSNDMTALQERIARDPSLRGFIAEHAIPSSGPATPTTDNWPYLYLERPHVPTLHLCLSITLLLLFVLARGFLMPKTRQMNWHFFFLGAAFLLLEFQNISKTTLLFGSTWLVNSFIISAILILILLANALSAVWKTANVRLLYGCLLASVVAAFLIPLSSFNALPYVARGLAASLFLNLPIFFAGLIFISSFKRAKQPDLALGSNLLGAGMGGILESLSFVTGINMLLIVVALLYFASLLLIPD